jgi:hypothetical protein
MNINLKDVQNYYNGDDWRLFDPSDFNTVSSFEVKNNSLSEEHDKDDFDQVAFYVERAKNRPY